ncbi:MAG TPA: hypothetical protein VFZ59_10995 [Verrucomicrobiae bacterium]|nr:hypothetical protein [Verrucomicrobiae bacterium]
MSRSLALWGGLAALILGIAVWRISDSSQPTEVPFETENRPPTAAPMCPWREPERDLKLFFPEATHHKIETRILSGKRLELAERLGRPPSGDENALYVYPVYREQTQLGVVLAHRVKGEFGAIELVLAVATNQQVSGLRLQRLREPENVTAALQNPQWLGSFVGKRAESSWQPEHDISDLPPEARVSGAAVTEGVRSLLILLAMADQKEPHH